MKVGRLLPASVASFGALSTLALLCHNARYGDNAQGKTARLLCILFTAETPQCYYLAGIRLQPPQHAPFANNDPCNSQPCTLTFI
jgi:hypothetical protein